MKTIKIVHISPGRIRLQNDAFLERIPDLDALLEIPGVTEVTYNKLIGSLTLLFPSTDIISEQVLERIKSKFPRTQFVKALIPTEGLSEKDLNTLSKMMYDGFWKLNQGIRKGLGGHADLTSLVPLLFTLWGLEELIRNPIMPRWYDILRAADSTFMQFRKDYGEHVSALH